MKYVGQQAWYVQSREDLVTGMQYLHKLMLKILNNISIILQQIYVFLEINFPFLIYVFE